MGKSKKGKSEGAASTFTEDDDILTSVQTILRRHLSQTTLPQKICGYEKERRYKLSLVKNFQEQMDS